MAETVLNHFPGSTARYLDNPVARTAAREDPVRFVRYDDLMLIDEVQRVPDLWLAIKELVDREPRPGRFLLTGSARLLGLRSLPDALPGRSETIELWPLSQGEIDDAPDGFIDAAFSLGADLFEVPDSSAGLARRDYLARAARGGYPEAVRRNAPSRRQRFFSSYLADIMSRDIHQVADIQRTGEMRQLLSLLAGQTSGLLNTSRLASDLGLSAPTIRSYLSILETVFVVRVIPAYSANATQRSVGTPKITSLLEDNAGRVIGIEVKAAETVRTDDFKPLRILRDRLGDRFIAGFVLYCGPQRLSFGDRLACLPISALWTTSAPALDPV